MNKFVTKTFVKDKTETYCSFHIGNSDSKLNCPNPTDCYSELPIPSHQ